MVPLALSHRRSTRPFALLTALMLTACSHPQPVATLSAAAENILQAALNNRTGARLTVTDAASRVQVQTADLPGLLYRITTPAGSGLRPAVTGPAGQLRLTLQPTADDGPGPGPSDDGPDQVTIVLNQAVRWDLRLPAGAGEEHLDLTGGQISRLDLGPAGLLTAALPHPHGTIPITLTDGTGTVRLTTPHHTPIRIRLRGGARHLSVPWTARPDAAPGETLAPLAWPSATDRYTLDAHAPVQTLTLR